MLADVVFARDLQEIVEQLLPLRKIARPWIARAEGERIGMVRRIDAAAGIAVDIPGAADLVFLLDDGVGDAETAKRDTERNRADAGADDQDMLLRQRLVGRARAPARVTRHKSHLFAHQRRVFAGDVFAERYAHHLQHQFIAGIGDDRLGLAMFIQLEHGGADFVLDLLRHAGVRVRDQANVTLGPVGRLQPAFVAGQVHQHHQQHADVALGDGRGEVKCLARHLDVHAQVLFRLPAHPASRHRRPNCYPRYSRHRPAD